MNPDDLCARKGCGHRRKDHKLTPHPLKGLVRADCKFCDCKGFIGRG